MAGITWQQAASALIIILTSFGTVTYTDLFGVLFSLKGMDYNFTGNISCGSECNISINTTTSYWRYEFANYSGTKYENKILFKKQARSRTLHINTDNIDKIITTQKLLDNGSWIPYDIPVDWMVPTYGYKWRFIKDDDSWERSKLNKIKLIFHKNPGDTIKWSFGIEDYVDIDPILFPPYNISENIVSIDNEHVNLKAYPHTLPESGYVTFNLTSKQFIGDIDIVWGFNSSIAMPKSAELYKPHNITETITYTCDSPYRYNYTTTPKHFWCWHDYNETVMNNETNESYNISKTDLIFEHSFDSAYPQNSSVAWYETHTEDYIDVHNKMNKINFEYGGMDTWYYTKNVPVSAGTEYSIKSWVDVPFNQGGGKYWFCVKPSSMTIQQAQSNGHLYCLDPWYNSSWTYYRPTEVNVSENVTDYQLLVNVTNKTNAQDDCSDMRFTLEDNVTELNYWIEECNVNFDYALIWVNVTLDTYNGPQIGYWYGNTTTVTCQSDADNTLGIGLQHFYPIHGDIEDKIGSLDGTSINTPTLTTDQKGYSGSAYDFDAGDGFSLTNSDDWDIYTVNKSFIFWMKSDTTAATKYIFGNSMPSSPYRGYWFDQKHSGTLKPNFYEYPGGVVDADDAITTDWTHFVVTKEADGSLALYRDGVKQADTSDVVGNTNNTELFVLGGVRTATLNYDGKISEFRIYNTTLTQAQINSTYAATEPTYSIGAEQTETVDNTAPTYSLNTTNSTLAGTNILHSLKWEDDTALSGYIFEFCNGTWNGTDCGEIWLTPTAIIEKSSEHAVHGVANTIDNNLGTGWGENDGTKVWHVLYDMGATYDMSQIRIYTDPQAQQRPCSVQEILVCDDDACSGESNLLSEDCSFSGTVNQWNYCSFQKTSGRYIKINGTGNGAEGDNCGSIDWSMFWLYEFDANSGTYWVNSSYTAMTGTANYSNVTKWVNSTVGANIAWRVHANDSSDNWSTSLTYNYTTTTDAEDSCTCPAINNNWDMDMADWCNITDDCDLGTGHWNLTGVGEVRCNATITTTNMQYPPSGSILWIQNNCWIKVT